MMQIPTHEDVVAAAGRLAGHVVRTPMLRNPVLDQITGGTILIKPETLQRTGSFKLRGATNAALQLSERERRAGVVTHSSGNHGQALACAAAQVGAKATIFMPEDAPLVKVESTRRWGAEIVHYDRVRDDRDAMARAHAARTGAALIPPFDHPHVIAGQGTLALELVQDAGAAGLTLDAMLASTGGGGLIAGCALAFEGASPGTEVYAVEPEGADDTVRSLKSGVREGNPPGGSQLCDALLSKMPGELTFAVNQRRLAGGVAVSDQEVLAAIAFAFTHLKLVVEPGGAVCLAALLAGKFDAKGRVVGVVLSGGNVDPSVFARALAA
ncbi:MAG TPA: threonine/serine dehydratase [Acetobacteraceae bacterium]|jgi:threonine dehydratase|nr:threonine/serine dehydratase [Acetobacteraceae bacterium]